MKMMNMIVINQIRFLDQSKVLRSPIAYVVRYSYVSVYLYNLISTDTLGVQCQYEYYSSQMNMIVHHFITH